MTAKMLVLQEVGFFSLQFALKERKICTYKITMLWVCVSSSYVLNQITSFNTILYECYVGDNPNFMLFNFL
jgi:hypothetical protein